MDWAALNVVVVVVVVVVVLFCHDGWFVRHGWNRTCLCVLCFQKCTGI